MNIFGFIGSAHINCLLPTAYFSMKKSSSKNLTFCSLFRNFMTASRSYSRSLKKVQVKLDFLLAFS